METKALRVLLIIYIFSMSIKDCHENMIRTQLHIQICTLFQMHY